LEVAAHFVEHLSFFLSNYQLSAQHDQVVLVQDALKRTGLKSNKNLWRQVLIQNHRYYLTNTSWFHLVLYGILVCGFVYCFYDLLLWVLSCPASWSTLMGWCKGMDYTRGVTINSLQTQHSPQN